jgi:hypothetical protein
MRRIVGTGVVVLFAAIAALPAAAQTDPLDTPALYSFGDASGMDFFGGAGEPQQKAKAPAGKSKPLFDFRNSQMNLAIGGVLWGGDFEADPDFAAAASYRVPMPALPTERFGIFVELFAGHIARDLPDYYEDTEGIYFGGVLGVDFSFVKSNDWMLLGQVGLAYVNFNDITGTENGMGLMVGLEGGTRISWDRRSNSWFTVSPQLFYDSNDYFLVLFVGIAFGF